MPATVERELLVPTLPGSWTQTVPYIGATLAVRDFACESDEHFLETMRAFTRDLYSSPMYKLLFFVSSPSRLLRGVSDRWSHFHRGSRLRLLDPRERGATFAITHPPGLFHPLIDRMWGDTIAVALQAAGAEGATQTPSRAGPGEVRYEIEW